MTAETSRPGLQVLQPPGWGRPKGYANGIAVAGRLVMLAGMVGWNPVEQRFETDDFVEQALQALRNIVTTLREANAEPQHIVRLTWFVTDREEYRQSLPRLGEAYRAVMGTHYPAMTVVAVSGLVEDAAKVEIEATAVVPG